MEASTINTPNVAPTSAVATPTPIVATPNVVEATPTPTPTPTPNVAMAEGGSVQSEGGVKSFFKSLNWIEVGLTILGVTALIYTIHYYKYKSKDDKMVNNELQRQIDEIKMNLQSSLKGKYKTI